MAAGDEGKEIYQIVIPCILGLVFFISAYKSRHLSHDRDYIGEKVVLSDQYFDLSKTLKSVSFMGRTHYLPKMDNEHASLARSNPFYRDTMYASYIDNACYLEKFLKILGKKMPDKPISGFKKPLTALCVGAVFFIAVYILFIFTSVFNSVLGVFKWLVDKMSKSTVLFIVVVFVVLAFYNQIIYFTMCLAVFMFIAHYIHFSTITIFENVS